MSEATKCGGLADLDSVSDSMSYPKSYYTLLILRASIKGERGKFKVVREV